VEGEEVDMVVEGWCAVLSEMSVPMLIGGDIIRQYDALARPKARSVVLQDTRKGRVSVPSYTLSEMVTHIIEHPHTATMGRVWEGLVQSARSSRIQKKQCMVNRTRIPPRSMKVVKVRYVEGSRVADDALFMVKIIKEELTRKGDWDEGMKIKYAQGWEPEEGGSLCRGYPTVTVYNHSEEWMEVQPQSIRVEVYPMQEITRYISEDVLESEAVPELKVHSITHTPPVGPGVEERPDEYPEELWDLVSPEDKVKVASEFLRFPDQRLKQCIDDLYYKLAVHVDRRPVETHPWLRRSIQIDKKGDEDKQESGKAEKTAEVMDMVGVATPACETIQTREVRNSLGLGTAGVSEDNAPRENRAETEDASEKRVFEFFRDQLRIKKELDKQIGGTTRLINEWAPGGDGGIQIGGENHSF
jgi:hypothetical protein